MRPAPGKTRGLGHLLAAAGHAGAGLRRLLAEPAFRHEILFSAALLAALALAGASGRALLLQGVLLLALAATEALNTAIELIVDRLSPDWSLFARDAKDLGSLAVLCLVLANLAFAGAVVVGLV
ncbi:diacylglycerol kinase [Aurantimonas sp. Leaf443]|nr:diacylglycerol kinase [Aurantimonas sp. Leaf443]